MEHNGTTDLRGRQAKTGCPSLWMEIGKQHPRTHVQCRLPPQTTGEVKPIQKTYEHSILGDQGWQTQRVHCESRVGDTKPCTIKQSLIISGCNLTHFEPMALFFAQTRFLHYLNILPAPELFL